MSGLVNIQIEEFMVSVDMQTANELQANEQMEKEYAEQIRASIQHSSNPAPSPEPQCLGSSSKPFMQPSTSTSGSCSSIAFPVLWSSKHPTPHDICATAYFLELRKRFNAKFEDKKHCKSMLWSEIGKEMNKKGFYFGEKESETAEKLRKKFSNMQAIYLKYKDKKRTTGEGKVLKPPFFDELDEILGNKHKSMPTLTIDSIELGTHKSDVSEVKENNKTSEEVRSNLSETATLNRFKTKNEIKPTKNSIMSKMYELQVENMNQRKNEFDRLMTYLETQSSQRHYQMMALLENKNKHKDSKKRKRSDSDSD